MFYLAIHVTKLNIIRVWNFFQKKIVFVVKFNCWNLRTQITRYVSFHQNRCSPCCPLQQCSRHSIWLIQLLTSTCKKLWDEVKLSNWDNRFKYDNSSKNFIILFQLNNCLVGFSSSSINYWTVVILKLDQETWKFTVLKSFFFSFLRS